MGRRSLLAQGAEATVLQRAGVTGARRRAEEAAAEGRGAGRGSLFMLTWLDQVTAGLQPGPVLVASQARVSGKNPLFQDVKADGRSSRLMLWLPVFAGVGVESSALHPG